MIMQFETDFQRTGVWYFGKSHFLKGKVSHTACQPAPPATTLPRPPPKKQTHGSFITSFLKI